MANVLPVATMPPSSCKQNHDDVNTYNTDGHMFSIFHAFAMQMLAEKKLFFYSFTHNARLNMNYIILCEWLP